MSAARLAFAVLPLAALAAAAATAQAAPEVKTLPCVPYVLGQDTMPILVQGFTPGNSVTLYTNTTADPTPRVLTSSPLDGVGMLRTVTAPPSFTKSNAIRQTFNLIAEDKSNPAIPPVLATAPFQVVRFGLAVSPAPQFARSKVTYTARGFVSGLPIYIHFRFRGKTRRTVKVGLARGVCGIASKRMRALPTTVRFGTWKLYVDQTEKFSPKTIPQWEDSFQICRGTC